MAQVAENTFITPSNSIPVCTPECGSNPAEAPRRKKCKRAPNPPCDKNPSVLIVAMNFDENSMDKLLNRLSRRNIYSPGPWSLDLGGLAVLLCPSHRIEHIKYNKAIRHVVVMYNTVDKEHSKCNRSTPLAGLLKVLTLTSVDVDQAAAQRWLSEKLPQYTRNKENLTVTFCRFTGVSRRLQF